jgi:hypothetical protein
MAFFTTESAKNVVLRLAQDDFRERWKDGRLPDFLTTVLAEDIMQPVVQLDPLPPYPVGR